MKFVLCKPLRNCSEAKEESDQDEIFSRVVIKIKCEKVGKANEHYESGVKPNSSYEPLSMESRLFHTYLLWVSCIPAKVRWQSLSEVRFVN